VFADDSGIIIDGITGNIFTNLISHLDASLTVRNSDINAQSVLTVVNQNRSKIEIIRESDTPLGDFTKIGNINYLKSENGINVAPVINTADNTGWYVSHDPAGNHNIIANYLKWGDGKLGLGRQLPAVTLDVAGNALFDDEVTASSFIGDLIGSVFSDTSTMLIDGTDGKIFAANLDVIGETGNAPAGTGTVDSWLEVTVNGNTKYIPLYD